MTLSFFFLVHVVLTAQRSLEKRTFRLCLLLPAATRRNSCSSLSFKIPVVTGAPSAFGAPPVTTHCTRHTQFVQIDTEFRRLVPAFLKAPSLVTSFLCLITGRSGFPVLPHDTVVIMATQTQIPRLLEERNKYRKNLRTNAVQSLSLFGEKSMSNPAVDNCSVRGCTVYLPW